MRLNSLRRGLSRVVDDEGSSITSRSASRTATAVRAVLGDLELNRFNPRFVFLNQDGGSTSHSLPSIAFQSTVMVLTRRSSSNDSLTLNNACTTDENNPNESDLPNSDKRPPDGGLVAWLTVFGAQVSLSRRAF